ncbi:MAG TPA: dual specificity protein phosphatase family protein [Terriglobales bacterium]|nr:dual specificity protein phosphatase family protein [Terriglobales bacterium]
MARTFRSFRVLAVPLLLAITVCTGEEPQQKGGSAASHSARTIGQKRKIKGVGNFGEVTPTLFRGAQPSHEGFEALAKMGIDIVVDARGDRTDGEGKEVGRLGMQYVAIPWHCPFPNDDVHVRFLKLLQENPKKRVFVHCRLGDDRTGMMIAAYRMAAQGWTADEAMNEMQQFGFSSVHHWICPGLASYEKSFPEHLRSNPAFEGLRSPTQSGAK